MTTPSRSRGRPPMPLDRIVATALEILDDEGVDALSMRALAQRLGSGTATLYRHYAGRDELVAHVVDAVMGEVPAERVDVPSTTWQHDLETVAHDMFDVLRRHPNLALLMIERTPIGPNALALRERALRRLLDSGFPPHLAVRTWATFARYVLGIATQFGTRDPDEQQSAAWAEIDPVRFPASIAVAGAVPVPLEDEFTFGLTLLISGLERRLLEDAIEPDRRWRD